MSDYKRKWTAGACTLLELEPDFNHAHPHRLAKLNTSCQGLFDLGPESPLEPPLQCKLFSSECDVVVALATSYVLRRLQQCSGHLPSKCVRRRHAERLWNEQTYEYTRVYSGKSTSIASKPYFQGSVRTVLSIGVGNETEEVTYRCTPSTMYCLIQRYVL